MKTYKTKLKLNNKQRIQLFKNAGTSRFAYNLTLQMQDENYKNGGKFLRDCEIRKQITILKQTELSWLYNFDCDIVKQAVKDACRAYEAFFKGLSKKPRFHSKKHTKPSFYVDGWRLKIKNGYIKIPNCKPIPRPL